MGTCFGRSWQLKRPVQLSVSFKMRVSEVMKLYNTTINKILKMNWLGLLESASLLALNIDFKIWFGAC